MTGLVDAIRSTVLGSWAAKLWKRLAPQVQIRRRFHGAAIYFDLRDNLIYLFRSRRQLENDEKIYPILQGRPGTVWDVGANVGIVAIPAAVWGNSVVAFELSQKSLGLMRRSLAANKVSAVLVDRAFSTTSFSYSAPESASTENRPILSPRGNKQSITFLEAFTTFGRPDIIKMDIEGAEEEFLRSEEFLRWIFDNNITWILEIHEQSFWSLIPDTIAVVRLDATHAAINPGVYADGILRIASSAIPPKTPAS